MGTTVQSTPKGVQLMPVLNQWVTDSGLTMPKLQKMIKKVVEHPDTFWKQADAMLAKELKKESSKVSVTDKDQVKDFFRGAGITDKHLLNILTSMLTFAVGVTSTLDALDLTSAKKASKGTLEAIIFPGKLK